MKDDAYYMSLALELARQSRPSPNPRVGAIIVNEDRIIGKGFHLAPGLPHAEIEALKDASAAGESVAGATIYVTLEPCCHVGRTGPCCVALHDAGIGRVVAGMKDPDPLVAGKGVSYLQAHQHEVTVGVLEKECTSLLDTYIAHRTLHRPLIHLKAAVTLDGFIAATTGDSKWITGKAARARGHQLRAAHDAILVGIGTVLADNPTLTVRDAAGRNPTRVVLDSALRIPTDCNLLQTTAEAGVVILHGPNAPSANREALLQFRGVELRQCQMQKDRLDITDVVAHLNNLGFLSVLVEGGSAVHGAFIQAGFADRFSLFIAPKILGTGIPWATLPGFPRIQDAITAVPGSIRTTLLDGDTLIEGRLS